MEISVSFRGRKPVPQRVDIGMERENKVTMLSFSGMPDMEASTAYLHINLASNSDVLEIIDGKADVTRTITQFAGSAEAFVEVMGADDRVWHSQIMELFVGALPILGEKIEQAYPTAFEQALAQTAADKAAAAKSAADAAATAAGIVTKEAARQAAETARSTAESQRVKAESKREQATTAALKSVTDTVEDVQEKLASGAFNGPQGPQGPQGEKGGKGDTGVVGPQGEKGEPGLDAPQIDDTTVSDAAPWSSQHIVDMLCPPLEESGNPVVCYPVAGSKLGVKASWEPTQEGTGTPSPDNIRPIHGRTQVKVERCGKNLLKNKGNKIIKGIEWTFDDQGLMSIKGTIGQDLSDYFFWGGSIENAEAFTTHADLALSSNYITNNPNCIFGVRTDSGLLQNSGRLNSLSIPSGTRIYGVFMRVLNATVDYSGIYAQLEPGSTVTPYEPYIGSTATLTLPSTIYGADLQADGEGQETWGCIESYAGEALPAGWICDRAIYTDGATPPTGAQVAYKLATPVPFTATGGGTIKALSGANTVLTDADALTVTGRADPIHIIQQLQAASAASAQALADVERAVTDI